MQSKLDRSQSFEPCARMSRRPKIVTDSLAISSPLEGNPFLLISRRRKRGNIIFGWSIEENNKIHSCSCFALPWPALRFFEFKFYWLHCALLSYIIILYNRI